MEIIPIKTRIFKEGEKLENFIREHIPVLANASIIAVTSKIVALSEGRVRTAKNETQKEEIIRSESTWMKRTKHVLITLKDGILMANAGVDESNADGKLILLPEDSYASAEKIRAALLREYRCNELGVVITDSRVAPMRAGVVGIALGYAGFKGVRDYRGKADIFGREMIFTRTNIADSLAIASVLVMGEGNEQYPLAIAEDAPVEFTDVVDIRELKIEPSEDMYAPILALED